MIDAIQEPNALDTLRIDMKKWNELNPVSDEEMQSHVIQAYKDLIDTSIRTRRDIEKAYLSLSEPITGFPRKGKCRRIISSFGINPFALKELKEMSHNARCRCVILPPIYFTNNAYKEIEKSSLEHQKSIESIRMVKKWPHPSKRARKAAKRRMR